MHELALRPDDEGEPRMFGTDLGGLLEYAEPRTIRKLIRRHLSSLEELGNCPTVAQFSGSRGPSADD